MLPSRYIIIVTILFFIYSPDGIAQDSRIELQNDVNIELLGRCLIYSFSYQRLINPTIGVEMGMSVIGGSSSSTEFFTGGCRLYLLQKDATPCISGGIVVLAAPSNSAISIDDRNSNLYGYVGPGFEYRSSSGFVLRGTVYFIISNGFFVWPGVQVGVAF